MPLRARFVQGNKRLVRQRAVQDRALERELDNVEKQYQRSLTKALRIASKDGEAVRTVLTEGDSWFRYPIGKSIPYYVNKHDRTEVLNLASPGDEGKAMLGFKQRERLIRVLKNGPMPRKKFDVLMFSAGGNDLLGGGAFHYWLQPYEAGMTPNDILDSQHLKHAFGMLDVIYEELFDLRDKHSKKTTIYTHAYDFAQANNKGVCGLGPWLYPSLKSKRIPKSLHNPIVEELLKRFRKRLVSLSRKGDKIRFIETQGLLKPNQWPNEIHPNNSGFKRLAKQFTQALDEDFPIK